MPAMIFGLGPTEIIIILVIVLLLFGGSKIPELMRGLGQGIREFKKGASDLGDEDKPKLEAKSENK
ncbi:MAG: twin-arginine translocase TatA/TatE family subunit [Abditibacteriales bacterium]|nr:twin-arginine translocase TatA/TatE family subunit [Abditibacteriales bacterium]MDW8365511.1 twin-arginine translocase TatA/TatE family subunit [Abditibacteriales bacterium]